VGWFNDKLSSLRGGRSNRREHAGAYEGSSAPGPAPYGGAGSRALDPDEAWDTRVGYGYDDEHELGMQGRRAAGDNPYEGGGYQMNVPGPAGGDDYHPPSRGRSPGPAARGAASLGAAPQNPFGDGAEPSNMSLRGVSPRPIDTAAGGGGGVKDNSPTDRKSVFRESV
jgi:hypothetical protein